MGRVQVVKRRNITYYLDGAHNEDSIKVCWIHFILHKYILYICIIYDFCFSSYIIIIILLILHFSTDGYYLSTSWEICFHYIFPLSSISAGSFHLSALVLFSIQLSASNISLSHTSVISFLLQLIPDLLNFSLNSYVLHCPLTFIHLVEYNHFSSFPLLSNFCIRSSCFTVTQHYTLYKGVIQSTLHWKKNLSFTSRSNNVLNFSTLIFSMATKLSEHPPLLLIRLPC